MGSMLEAFEVACDTLRGPLPYHWQRLKTVPATNDETLIKQIERQMGVHIVRKNRQSALQIGGIYIVKLPQGAYAAMRYDEDRHLVFISAADKAVDNTNLDEALKNAHILEAPDKTIPGNILTQAEPVGDFAKSALAIIAQTGDAAQDEYEYNVQYQVLKASLFNGFDLQRLVSADPVAISLIKRMLWSTLFITLMVVVIPLYMNAVYSRILPAHAGASLWAFSFAVLIATATEYVLRKERQRLSIELNTRIHTTIEPSLVRRLMKIGINQDNEWGRLQNRSLNDWKIVRNFAWAALNANLIDLPFICLFLLFILLLGHWIVLVPLAVILFIGFLMWQTWREAELSQRDKPLFRDPPNSMDIHVASIIGRPDIVTDRFMSDSEADNENWVRRYIRASKKQRDLLAVVAGQMVIVVIVAYYLVLNQYLNPGAIFAVILLCGRMMQPLMGAANLAFDAYGACQAYKRVDELLRSTPHDVDAVIRLETAETLKSPLWNVERASFYYNNENIILDNISLSIPKGQKLAVVGPQKSGKSTLLQILAGQLPLQKGTVNFSERPLHAGDESIKRLIHYAWQEHVMLASSVYEYLCLEDRLSREECENVLRQLDLVSGEMQIADKLEMTWRDAGLYPNPAHRQMLASARLALSKRKILLLDEPTSQLSQKQEMRIVNLLGNKLTPDTTMVVTTDRYDLITLTDRVVYLDQGHIKFDGPTKEFLDRSRRPA